MLSSLLFVSLLSLSLDDVLALPHDERTTSPLSIGLRRRSPSTPSTKEEWGAWAKSHREAMIAKYGGSSQPAKRSSGTNLLVNQNYDSSFYGSLAVGTPAVSYNVIMDTGSADLWIADANCRSCGSVATLDTSSSSTYTNLSTSFTITYGSGGASGSLGKDTIQMAGFSVSDQVFATCDEVTSGLLQEPVSGLLGLGFSSIASSGATPLWQTLVESGAWDEPVMAFQLTRYNNDNSADSLEQGGTFTMGALNTSLYTGDIDYNNTPDGQESYWLQTISSITVQGSSISLSSNLVAAIDTGTTLVGGPAQYISEIYAQIPNSQVGSGDYDGYYIYPCDTDVNVTMAFGGQSWSISSDDFKFSQISRDECLGGFFELSTGSNLLSWIVGDVFLKNVYSVYRYNPASVGFAQLSDLALSMNGADAVVPSATIGSAAATVSATGTRTNSSGNGAASWASPRWSLLGMAIATTVFLSS